MTLKAFFRRARRGRKWIVHPYSGRVRCEDGFCPLAAFIREALRVAPVAYLMAPWIYGRRVVCLDARVGTTAPRGESSRLLNAV